VRGDLPTILVDRAAAADGSGLDMFTGGAAIQEISDPLGMPYIEMKVLFMDAGSRSRPHRHEVEQALYFLEGPGVVAIDGGPDQLVPAGGFVVIPAEAVHMHGAPDSNPAVYLSQIAKQHESDFTVPIPPSWAAYERTAP
jgi:quercetin dioxygenase-like cupin family protein